MKTRARGNDRSTREMTSADLINSLPKYRQTSGAKALYLCVSERHD